MKRRMTDAKTKSVTRVLFLSTLVCSLVWVFISYGLAIYATVFLGEVYTMAELSEPAIKTILGVVVAKVVGNIFEHNSGGIFGESDSVEENGGNG